jgi:hypothetical protein
VTRMRGIALRYIKGKLTARRQSEATNEISISDMFALTSVYSLLRKEVNGLAKERLGDSYLVRS